MSLFTICIPVISDAVRVSVEDYFYCTENQKKKSEKERWEIIASFPTLGDIRPRFSPSVSTPITRTP